MSYNMSNDPNLDNVLYKHFLDEIYEDIYELSKKIAKQRGLNVAEGYNYFCKVLEILL